VGVRTRSAWIGDADLGAPLYIPRSPARLRLASRAGAVCDAGNALLCDGSGPRVRTDCTTSEPIALARCSGGDRRAAGRRVDAHGDLRRLVEGLPGIEPRGGSSGGAMFVLPALPAARVAPVGDSWPASVRDSAPDEIEIDLGQPRVVRTIGFPLRWHYGELDR